MPWTSHRHAYGYFFQVLKGQGPAAPMGEIDYVIRGAMIGGFALIATPAEYGVTGVQTFIVNHNGISVKKDLGPDLAGTRQKDRALQPGQDLGAHERRVGEMKTSVRWRAKVWRVSEAMQGQWRIP